MTPAPKLVVNLYLHAGTWRVEAAADGFHFHEGGSNTLWVRNAQRALDRAHNRAQAAWKQHQEAGA